MHPPSDCSIASSLWGCSIQLNIKLFFPWAASPCSLHHVTPEGGCILPQGPGSPCRAVLFSCILPLGPSCISCIALPWLHPPRRAVPFSRDKRLHDNNTNLKYTHKFFIVTILSRPSPANDTNKKFFKRQKQQTKLPREERVASIICPTTPKGSIDQNCQNPLFGINILLTISFT